MTDTDDRAQNHVDLGTDPSDGENRSGAGSRSNVDDATGGGDHSNDAGEWGDRSNDVDDSDLAFENGRYLFCLVALDDVETDPGAFSATGLDDGTPYVVSTGGIGAVVQPCASLFDSDDIRQVQRWLLAHQRVVDEAGETFGTPLPFQFDTILKGNDAAVRDWLDRSADRLESELESFAGHWEYRIQVTWDDDRLTAAVLDANEELRAMRPEDDSIGEGTSFLREKQFEQRLARARQRRREELAEDLEARLRPLAGDIRSLGSPRLASALGVSADDRPEPFARLAVLADEDRAGEIGDELDEKAAIPGVEVTYTGPWPPYTFAPELGAPE